MHKAALQGHVEVVPPLLAAGAKVDATDEVRGSRRMGRGVGEGSGVRVSGGIPCPPPPHRIRPEQQVASRRRQVAGGQKQVAK